MTNSAGTSSTVAQPRRVIGVFAQFVYGHYYGDILAGVVAAARESDATIVAHQTSVGVLSSGYHPHTPETPCPAAWDHLDAAIVVRNQGAPREFIEALRAAGKQVIMIIQRDQGDLPTVAFDNAGGVRSVIEHLIGHGHAAIGFVGGPEGPDAVERYAYYRAAMTANGLEALPAIAHDQPEYGNDEHGYLAAKRYLAGGPRCTAVLVNTDSSALGFMRGLAEAGYEFPRDLAVVGMDDIEQAALHIPPLATVALDFVELGARAFALAARAADGEVISGRTLVGERLVPRESCGCAAQPLVPRDGDGEDSDTRLVSALVRAMTNTRREAIAGTPAAAEIAQEAALVLQNAGRSDPTTFAELGAAVFANCANDAAVDAVVEAIRRFAESSAEQPQGADRSSAASRLWATAMDLCHAVTTAQLRGRMRGYLHLQRMVVKQNFVATSLLQRDHQDLRSLGWLWRTEAVAGCLALWTSPGDWTSLEQVGVYDADRPDRAVDPRPVSPQAFPPDWMLRDAGGSSRLVYVLPVRFEGSDWGVLAVTGDTAMQSTVVQEMFRQWIMIITVALDQEAATSALDRQAKALATASETERLLLEEVRLSEERYALAAEAANDGLWDFNLQTGAIYYSSRWKALLGHHGDEIGSSPWEWLSRVHPDELAIVEQMLSHGAGADDAIVEFEHRLRDAHGDYRWMACRGRSVVGADGKLRRLVGSITDVTVRRLLQDELLQQALYDDLTGLAKRSLFTDRLNRALAMAERRRDYWFAALFIDLDGFKQVNDTLGHAVGDQLLVEVAARLTGTLRANDTAARIGGDEFTVLLNDVRDVADLPGVLQRLQAELAAPYLLGAHTLNVTAAVGVATSKQRYADAAEMLKAADAAMYRAKQAGGNRYEIAESDCRMGT